MGGTFHPVLERVSICSTPFSARRRVVKRHPSPLCWVCHKSSPFPLLSGEGVVKRDSLSICWVGSVKATPSNRTAALARWFQGGVQRMDSPFLFARDLCFGDSRPILRQGRRAAFQMIPFRRTVNKTFSLFPAGGHCFCGTFPAEGKSALRSEPVKRRGRLRGSPQN